MLGGGCDGHISQLMDAAIYENVSNTRYTKSTDLVSYTKHCPMDTAVAQSDAAGIHKEYQRVYYLYENADAALKK